MSKNLLVLLLIVVVVAIGYLVLPLLSGTNNSAAVLYTSSTYQSAFTTITPFMNRKPLFTSATSPATMEYYIGGQGGTGYAARMKAYIACRNSIYYGCLNYNLPPAPDGGQNTPEDCEIIADIEAQWYC